MAKRKPQESSGGGCPEWMATYGDLVTLLMCFFVLLFAMSSLDTAKFMQFAQSFNSSNQLSLLSNGEVLMDMMGNGILQFPVPPNDKLPDSADEDLGDEQKGIDEEALTELEQKKVLMSKDELSQMVDDLNTYFADNMLMDGIQIEQEDQYIKITMLGNLTFDSGSHSLTSNGKEILRQIVPMLREYDENDIMIEGYTDNVALGAQLQLVYGSNRMLSNYRANEVLEFFEEEGIDPYRMRSVGMGELYAVGDNNTDEGRQLNRRVEIKIYSKLYSGGE